MFSYAAINRNRILEPHLLVQLRLGIRLMATLTSRKVLNRSEKKRVPELEIVAEKHKNLLRCLHMFEILKKERERVIQVTTLELYRPQINVPKPHKVSEFLRKSPELFELYEDPGGILWCGLTPAAQSLIEEEEDIIAQNSDKAAEYLTRMLMMSVDKRISLLKLQHLRRDLGLPKNFRKRWVHCYPELFKVGRPFAPKDETEYLELVAWRPEWTMTELEKNKMGISNEYEYEYDCKDHVPGLLRLAFPMKFPHEYKRTLFRHGGKIHHFQKTEYLSPYADAKGLKAGSREFDKRAVAVMHELLSFSTDKRLMMDYLTYFRREFVMPQKIIRLLLKYLGIFYVSQKGKKSNVFLTEAYKGKQLIEKHPLVTWKEKVQNLVGSRGKNRRIERYKGLQDEEDRDICDSESEDDSGMVETEGEEEDTYMSNLEEEASSADDF